MKTLLVIIVVFLAVGSTWYFRFRGEKPPEYQTVNVTEGPMTQVVTATGTLNPVVNVTVGSQISGNISELHADFNSSVKKDQIVATIEPSTFQATVHQCEGDLASAQAALELAQLTAKRKKELADQKAAPQADLDNAIATLNQAIANVKIKQANLEKAQVDLDRCAIRSPIDGTVISRSIDVGQTVAAAMNAPVLFLIANDLTKMQIDSAVAEADVGMIEEKQNVDFSVDAFPYRVFHGVVAQVRNAATTVQNVVTYDVVISVDNPDLKLKPGMTANVSIIVAHRENPVKVANSALRFRPPEEIAAAKAAAAAASPAAGGQRPPGAGGGKPRGGSKTERKVYVLAPGATKPEAVTVKVGISDGISTEITDGLKAGDVVVTGMTLPQNSPAAPSSNPFGGGPRRF
jgi:HlyD family secretion protein